MGSSAVLAEPHWNPQDNEPMHPRSRSCACNCMERVSDIYLFDRRPPFFAASLIRRARKTRGYGGHLIKCAAHRHDLMHSDTRRYFVRFIAVSYCPHHSSWGTTADLHGCTIGAMKQHCGYVLELALLVCLKTAVHNCSSSYSQKAGHILFTGRDTRGIS